MAERQEKYKNEGKSQELRRRRNEAVIELRKSKQESKFSKKRNLDENPVLSESMEIFSKILEKIHNCSLDELEDHVETIRLKLSIPNPPVDLVIQRGVVPILVHCLTQHDRPNLQFRATWALTNIASSLYEHTKAVVDCQGIPHLVNLLSSNYTHIASQAVWALGNISGDCAYMRDLCVQCGYVDLLLPLINANTPIDSLRTYAWAMSNLCRHKDPPPRKEIVLRLIPYVLGILQTNDSSTVVDGLWTVTYISDGHEDYIPILVQNEFMPILKFLITCGVPDYFPPLIRIFGNIASHNDHYYTQIILECGILELMIPLIQSSAANHRKETIWFISNLAAGTHSQIQYLIDSQCLPLIFDRLVNDRVLVKSETIWVFRNILAGGNQAQMQFVLNMNNFVAEICKLLSLSDMALQLDLLRCIFAMLSAATKTGLFEKVAIDVEVCEGLTAIEDLQFSNSSKVAATAGNIIKKYFSSLDVPETDM